MRSERIEFEGAGGTRLAGRLDRPDGRPRTYALFAHCFTCSKDVLAASRIARALTDHGIGVLRFDFTGLGGSDGEFENTDFTSNIADLVAAADHLREHHGPPAVLVGHSLGGAAVLAAAEHVPSVRAVVTIGAPAGTDHLLHLFEASREEIEEHGEAEVCLASRRFTIRREFLDDIAEQPQAERIARLDAALLVLHSPSDDTVGIDNAREIFDAARHPKSFVALDGADHLLSSATDARFAAGVIAAWSSRYVGGDTPDLPGGRATGAGEEASERAAETSSEQGVVVVRENGETRYGQEVVAGRHRFTADEPVPVGEDTGPSPYDLLLAGLGTCTSMTVRMYAARKKWDLRTVTVALKHGRIHAEDCEDCETTEGRLDHVERVIELEGDLDEDQRRRLLEIADKCPVHRTLHSEVVVHTSEGDPARLGEG